MAGEPTPPAAKAEAATSIAAGDGMRAEPAGTRGARIAMLGVVLAVFALHAIVCAWTPLAGDDWRHVLWAQGHHGSWLAAHRSFADAIGDALVRVPGLHAIGTPLATLALLAGVLTLAQRRLPRPGRWLDVLGLALISAMIWIALPRAGVMWFHRPYAAAQIWGGALAVWFAAPYRGRWRLAGRAWPAVMFVLGALAATTTRQLAVALVIGLVVAVVRTARADRRAWMWLGLAGVIAGVAADNVHAPWWEAGRLFTRFEPSLVIVAPVLRAGGQLITLIALLVLGRLVQARVIRRADAGDAGWLAGAPAAGDALAWLAAWLGLGLAMRIGPFAAEATLMPSALALCIAAWPYLAWLARVPALRGLVIGLAVIVHAVAWPAALRNAARLDDECTARLAAIAHTPAGGIARVPPYSAILPTYGSIGEDWNDPALREALARERWGLTDLELAPAFRVLEQNPDLAYALEVDHATDAQLAAAAPPARWPRELAAARRAFVAFVARLRTAAPDAIARLRVTNVTAAVAGDRPILAAWADRAPAAPVAPLVSHAAPDTTNHTAVRLPDSLVGQLPELTAVTAGGATPIKHTKGRGDIQLQRAERTVILACNADRCLAADAWIPKF